MGTLIARLEAMRTWIARQEAKEILIAIAIIAFIGAVVFYVTVYRGAKAQRELLRFSLLSDEEKEAYQAAKKEKDGKRPSEGESILWFVIFVGIVSALFLLAYLANTA
jgi:type II secretory pathway pseudopilin PulG